jgi:hypothetical protein
MAPIVKERMTVDNDDEITVFLIGMRINKPWKFWQWLPVVVAMPRMLSELSQHPELGLLSARTYFGFPNIMVMQYWRSTEALLSYAGDTSARHLPAWRAFNRRIGSNGDVGIWHETFKVPAGSYEAVYNNMPRFGMGQALQPVPAIGHRISAVARLHAEQRRDSANRV